MHNNKITNPLKSASIFFAVLSVIYLIMLAFEFSRGGTLAETIIHRKLAIVGLFFCCFFFVAFFKKSILAWWITMLFCAIMFTTSAIFKNTLPDKRWIFSIIVIYIFLLYYLAPKYDIYKEYIETLSEQSQ